MSSPRRATPAASDRATPALQVGRGHHTEDAMNILLWYLPFAMFGETCDLLIAECNAPAQAKPDEVRTQRPALNPTPPQR
jgi:hypothetical protein